MSALRAAEESERQALAMFSREIEQYREDHQAKVLTILSDRMAKNDL